MKFNSRWKPYEVLAVAVRSEVDAASLYLTIKRKVKSRILLQKIDFLVKEEKKHRRILERLFSQRFPGRKLRLPAASFLKGFLAPASKNFSVAGLFRAALQAEKFSEEFYKSASRAAGDALTRKLLEYLSRVERSHYFLVKSEIDLLSRFPDSYNAEDFHLGLGEDMVHLGP